MEEQKISPADSESETGISTPVSPHDSTSGTTLNATASKEVTADTVTEQNAVDNETDTINQQPSTGPQQPQQPQQTYQLPPGYAVDPATGQIFFIGQTIQQPVQPGYVQPGVIYTKPPPQQQPSPEQIAAQQAAAQQRYGQVINTVEKFLEGEATVADVVKTLYTSTSQDDQLWKGAIVGAAAAVLLTSEPVREAMGKTIGGVFPGLKNDK